MIDSWRWTGLGVLILFLLASCAALQAPAPTRQSAVPHRWDGPVSTLVIPVRGPQIPVKATTEAAVPSVIKGEGSGKRTLSAWFLKHDWHYWWTYNLKRTPLVLGFSGPKVRVATTIGGDLSAQWDTLPGEITSEVEADAGVEAHLAIGPDWKILPQTKVFLEVRRADVPIGIAWDGNFFGETISIVAPVQEALKPALEKLDRDLDQRLRTLDLKPSAEALWRDLQEPRALPGTENLWFTLDPQTVALGPLGVTEEGLSFSLTLTASPSLTQGQKPDPTRKPLPTASEAGTGISQLSLDFPVTLGWADASKMARARLAEELRPASGGKIKVQGLDASTDADRVLVRVQGLVSPPWPGPEVSAVLWLTGKVHWDRKARTLRLVGVTWEGQTKAFLDKNAAWLISDSWIKEVERALAWDMGPELDRLAAQSRSLNALTVAPHLALTLAFAPWDVVDMALSDKGPELLTRTTGTATANWIP